MPMPFTRPIVNRSATVDRGQLVRGSQPAFTMPVSNPIPLPMGGGKLHTIKNPTKVVPSGPLRVTPAAVA